MGRKVTLFFTQEGRELVLNNVETNNLGGLLSLPELAGENLSGKKLTVRETRTTLESRESVFPDTTSPSNPNGDITIFVYPAKSKAGMSYDEEQELLQNTRKILSILENQSGAKSVATSGPAMDSGEARRRELAEEAAKLRREMEGDNGYRSDEDDDY